MTIRQKLRLSILLLVVAFVVSTSTIAYTFHSISQATAYMAAVNYTIRLVVELSFLGYEYQTYREERAVMQWQSIHRQLGQHIATLAVDTAMPEDDAVRQRMHATHALLSTLFAKLTAQEAGTEALRLIGQNRLLRSNVLVADAHQLAVVSNRTIATRMHILLGILLGSFWPLLGACVFIGMAHHRLLRSLAALHEGATALGQGHLTRQLHVTGHDEFTDLAGTLNAMAEQLHTDIMQRQQAQAQLQQYAQELTRSNTDLEQFAYVASVLTQVLANLKMALEESGAVVTPTLLPTVLADPTQLLQLFQNLLSNATKFRAAAPPTVHISAERQEDAWRFAVRDNGMGIAPQYVGRIFAIFQRLHTRSRFPGTGIGLALCKKIVKRHGGRIWVESALGQGATFFFTLQHVREHSRDIVE